MRSSMSPRLSQRFGSARARARPGGQVAVEQREGLEGVGAGGTAGAGTLGVGRVEGVEEGVADVALAEEIERRRACSVGSRSTGQRSTTSASVKIRSLTSFSSGAITPGPPHPGIQLARDGQHGVADSLGVEPAAVHAAEERVLGIVGRQLGVGLFDWR